MWYLRRFTIFIFFSRRGKTYIDSDQESPIGFFPDLVKEIESITDHSIEITLVPFSFARINRELESGRQDCTIIIRQQERDELVVLGEFI